MDSQKNISRKELHLLIWKTPITTIFKKHNIPVTIIRNICKKLEIPTPPSGYWSKLKFKKTVDIPPLPTMKNENKETGLKLVDGQMIYEEHFQTAFYRIKNEIENNHSQFLKVSEKLWKPHPLIKAAKADLKNYKHPNGWMFKENIRYTSQNIVNIEVGKNNVSKALCFMDTFIKLLEKRNHSIVINGYHTEVVIFDERITIKCREILKRIKVKDLNSHYSSERTVLIPSGIIAFEMGASYWKREWRESKTKPLESKLSNIMASLELKAKKQLEERIEREKWHIEYEKQRKIEEAKKVRLQAEVTKFNQLKENAKRWQETVEIRNYIQAVETNAINKNTLTNELKVWINWAKEKADWYDPIIQKKMIYLPVLLIRNNECPSKNAKTLYFNC